MRTAQGGTKKWCPYCEETTICKAVNPSTLGYESGQRWYRTKHTDVRWFRRGLICQECDSEWLTAEIEESFLDELIALRDALKDVKENAEQYIEESNKASSTLESLTESLNVLKTLRVYKAQ
jgi:hypothetical protein